jgi:hypothetical protein
MNTEEQGYFTEENSAEVVTAATRTRQDERLRR